VFFITYSVLWSLVVFFLVSYITFITSLVVYLIPTTVNYVKLSFANNKSFFYILGSFEIFSIIFFFCLIYCGVFFSWNSPTLTAWFGHLIFSILQLKMTKLLILVFILTLLVLTNSLFFTSKEVYDYIIVILLFFYWLVFLFFVNSIFTMIFFIEVLSALLLLLIVTSVFSSAFFYQNMKIKSGHLFQNITPFSYIQSLLYFFWVSLISSLNLFLFCFFIYNKMLTFDWFLIEYVFTYFTITSSIMEVCAFSISWYIFLFCLFLKCGVVPLYIWKPSFFKGVPYYTIYIYICFFYFFLFIFIILLLTSYFADIFYFYTIISLLIITVGLFFLLLMLCEAYYIKSFLAVSSLLNSLFVFLALVAPSVRDLFF